MTFCLALSIRDFSLVAADTRINMVVNGEVVVHDGPTNLDVEVASPQYSLSVPFRKRKLARVRTAYPVYQRRVGCKSEASCTIYVLNNEQHRSFIRIMLYVFYFCGAVA
ncbi:MAG: hypothetical protein ACU84J_04915, partial [Gammaproteobacteria bacterium]